MENQTQVKAPIASEPVGTWINGIIMTTMNMGVEVGKTMLRSSQVIQEKTQSYKELEEDYKALNEGCSKQLSKIQELKDSLDNVSTELVELADEKKVLETELAHLKNYIKNYKDKLTGDAQLKLPLGDD